MADDSKPPASERALSRRQVLALTSGVALAPSVSTPAIASSDQRAHLDLQTGQGAQLTIPIPDDSNASADSVKDALKTQARGEPWSVGSVTEKGGGFWSEPDEISAVLLNFWEYGIGSDIGLHVEIPSLELPHELHHPDLLLDFSGPGIVPEMEDFNEGVIFPMRADLLGDGWNINEKFVAKYSAVPPTDDSVRYRETSYVDDLTVPNPTRGNPVPNLADVDNTAYPAFSEHWPVMLKHHQQWATDKVQRFNQLRNPFNLDMQANKTYGRIHNFIGALFEKLGWGVITSALSSTLNAVAYGVRAGRVAGMMHSVGSEALERIIGSEVEKTGNELMNALDENVTFLYNPWMMYLGEAEEVSRDDISPTPSFRQLQRLAQIEKEQNLPLLVFTDPSDEAQVNAAYGKYLETLEYQAGVLKEMLDYLSQVGGGTVDYVAERDTLEQRLEKQANGNEDEIVYAKDLIDWNAVKAGTVPSHADKLLNDQDGNEGDGACDSFDTSGGNINDCNPRTDGSSSDDPVQYSSISNIPQKFMVNGGGGALMYRYAIAQIDSVLTTIELQQADLKAQRHALTGKEPEEETEDNTEEEPEEGESEDDDGVTVEPRTSGTTYSKDDFKKESDSNDEDDSGSDDGSDSGDDSGSGSSAELPYKDALQHRYQFNGDGRDAIGDAHLSLADPTWTSSPAGGEAVVLQSGSHATAPDHPDFEAGPDSTPTFMFLTSPDEYGLNQTVINKGSKSTSKPGFNLEIYWADADLRVYITDQDGNMASVSLWKEFVGDWAAVGFTIDRDRETLGLAVVTANDYKYEETDISGLGDISTDDQLQLAGSDWDGAVDELLVWDTGFNQQDFGETVDWVRERV